MAREPASVTDESCPTFEKILAARLGRGICSHRLRGVGYSNRPYGRRLIAGLFAVFGRVETCVFGEDLAEESGVVVADGGGDVVNGAVGFEEQFAGVADADVFEVLLEGNAADRLELFGDIGHTEILFAADLGQGHVLGVVDGHVVADLGDHAALAERGMRAEHGADGADDDLGAIAADQFMVAVFLFEVGVQRALEEGTDGAGVVVVDVVHRVAGEHGAAEIERRALDDGKEGLFALVADLHELRGPEEVDNGKIRGACRRGRRGELRSR